MTPTGTSLLGLVKHVATVEIGYLGECVGRPSASSCPWDNEEAYEAGRRHVGRRRRVRASGCSTSTAGRGPTPTSRSATLGLDAPATVPWWPEERRETTLGYVLVHMLAETAHHAGHADIVREAIDGRGGGDHDEFGDAEYVGGLRREDPGRGRRPPRP